MYTHMHMIYLEKISTIVQRERVRGLSLCFLCHLALALNPNSSQSDTFTYSQPLVP